MSYTRSVSQLKGVTSCGERFRLERLMKRVVPATPAAWTALGVALHEAFVEWERSDRQIDVCEYFEQQFDAYIDDARVRQPNLDQWQVPPGTKSTESSIKNYRKRGLERDVPNYLQRCLEAEWEIYRLPTGEKALELGYELKLGSSTTTAVTVKGSIDRIQFWPESKMITLEDTKTGNVDEWDKRQLGVYAYAARTVYDIPIGYGRYWFTKIDRGGDWFPLSRYTEEYLAECYHTLDTIVDQRLFLPNPGKHCELCGVRPYCREQGWLVAG